MKRLTFLLGVLLLIGVGCVSETWQGFYYPGGCLECEDQWKKSPIFSTLEECRDWADAEQEESGNPNDDYECGKNCKNDGYFNVCEETVK